MQILLSFLILLIIRYSYGQESCIIADKCSCGKLSSCSFLNGVCGADRGISIMSKPVQTQYCRGAQSKEVSKENSNSPFVMGHTGGGIGYICEWDITVNGNGSSIELVFTREAEVNEDIVMKVFTKNSTSYYLTSKDLMSCSNTSVTKFLSDVTRLTIRSEQTSPNSSYQITFSFEQIPTITDLSFLIGIIIVGLLAIAFCNCCSAAVACKFIKDWIRATKEKSRNNYKYDGIKVLMDCMVNGKYRKIEEVVKEKQEMCSICLEPYKEEDDVHLTNECTHLFHSDCLNQWYRNSCKNKDFQCPFCRTINSANFKQKDKFINENDILQTNSGVESAEPCNCYTNSLEISIHIPISSNGLDQVMKVHFNNLEDLDI